MTKAFTKEELKAFRKDFDLAVIELEKKYGVSVSLGNITYYLITSDIERKILLHSSFCILKTVSQST